MLFLEKKISITLFVDIKNLASNQTISIVQHFVPNSCHLVNDAQMPTWTVCMSWSHPQKNMFKTMQGKTKCYPVRNMSSKLHFCRLCIYKIVCFPNRSVYAILYYWGHIAVHNNTFQFLILHCYVLYLEQMFHVIVCPQCCQPANLVLVGL